MKNQILRLICSVSVISAAVALAPTANARSESWTDAKGETFEATPSDIIGPWALFDNGKLLPLGLLSKEDCVRFYNALKQQPARSPNWKTATSKISAELYGRLLHYKGNEFEGDNEEGKPEPEFFIIFYTKDDRVQSWDLLSRSTPALYAKLQEDFPGLVQGVVFGFPQETIQDFMDVATNTKGTWLYTQFHEEVQMRNLQKLMPTNIYGIVVMTRDGVPLFGPDCTTDEQVKAIFDNFRGMLAHMSESDPKVWISRAHYIRAIQPLIYADGKCDPVLVGNPLDEAKLRMMKIYKLDVTFNIRSDGAVISVEVDPEGLEPGTVAMFTSGFKRGCLFVGAVDHGKYVDGTYHYHVELTP